MSTKPDNTGIYLNPEFNEVQSNLNVPPASDFIGGMAKATSQESSLPIQEFKPDTDTTGKPLILGNNSTLSTPTNYDSKWISKCSHDPTLLFQDVEGKWSISAGTKSRCTDYLDTYDIVLNLSGWTTSASHNIPIPELRHWENSGKQSNEVYLDWNDGQAIGLPLQFWKELVTYVKKNQKHLLVFCIGGHGRTGTAIASMMIVLYPKWTASDCMEWIWANYCEEAIETKAQEWYIERLAKERSRKRKGSKNQKAMSVQPLDDTCEWIKEEQGFISRLKVYPEEAETIDEGNLNVPLVEIDTSKQKAMDLNFDGYEKYYSEY